MIDIKTVPPLLQGQVKTLSSQIKEIQQSCPHDFQKIMDYDEGYSPRVDGYEVRVKIIKELHCPLCNLRKKFSEIPWRICHCCSGTMKIDHTEQFDGQRVTIHKCTSCGHEYDTT